MTFEEVFSLLNDESLNYETKKCIYHLAEKLQDLESSHETDINNLYKLIDDNKCKCINCEK